MTGEQLSLLPASKRVVLMRFADLGRDSLGDFALFRCRRCGAEIKYRIDISIRDTLRGIPCGSCNRKRNPPFQG
jgi:hypothetical protein